MENSLVLAVSVVASTKKKADKLYAASAAELCSMSHNADAVHLYLCAAQDSTLDSGVWKLVIQGCRDSLKPLGFKLATTRDFRPAFRGKNPLFSMVSIADDKAAKAAESERLAEQAAAIDEKDRIAKAAEQARIDAETTADDIACAAIDEANRLGIDLRDVLAAMHRQCDALLVALLAPRSPDTAAADTAAAS